MGSLLAAAAFLFSGWWYLRFTSSSQGAGIYPEGNLTRQVGLGGGLLMFERSSWSAPVDRDATGLRLTRSSGMPWWQLRRHPLPFVSHQRYAGSVYGQVSYDGYLVVLPLWLPFLALLLPTLWLWRRDRRKVRPGFCRVCDYNLTGSTTGRCPECGSPCEPAPEQSVPPAA